MTAKNSTDEISAATWTLLTDGAVTTPVTAQNVGGHPLKIKATTDANAPSNDAGHILWTPGFGTQGLTIAELFPGLTSPNRIWAYGDKGGRVTVSHA